MNISIIKCFEISKQTNLQKKLNIIFEKLFFW